MSWQPSGPCPSSILIVGEFPGEEELRVGMPFAGTSGRELDRMLHEAGIMRNQCFSTYAIRVRPPMNDLGHFIATRKADITPKHISIGDRMCLPVVADSLSALKQEIELCQPNVIIALGNAALWALTGQWGVDSWRGSIIDCTLTTNLPYAPKVIPTYTPGRVFMQWGLRVIAVHDLRQAKRHSMTRGIVRPAYNFLLRPTFSQATNALNWLLEQLGKGPFKISTDLETRAGHIACVGLAWSKVDALCIPLMCKEDVEGYWTLEQETQLIWLLNLILRHPNVIGVGQNFLYDAQYTNRHWLFTPSIARDTMLAQHTCFSNLPKGLDFLSSMYCEAHLYWKDEGKDWNYNIPEEQYWEYNCKDAVRTYEADETLFANIKSMGLLDVFTFQMELFYPVLETMIRGVRCDQATRSTFAMTLSEEIAKREQWIIDVVGYALNPKSPKQMSQFFYTEMGQKPVLNRKTKSPSCDDEALTKISGREPLLRPIIRKILELRSLGVFLSTFVNARLDADQRIRSSYNIAGTETYRFSSSTNAFGSGLNMQNIPKGGGDDEDPDALDLPNVRNLFIPDPGMTFFDIDLDSADLRIVVWESGAVEMQQMFAEGKKPYVEVAKEYYRDQSITKHHKAYPVFKALCHGTNYLGSAAGLAPRVGLLVHEVERVQKWYFGKFPQIKKWQDDIKDQVDKRRMVQNVFGYRCYFFDRIEGTIYNQAVAWIPQSTVGCLINRAYVNIYNNLKEVQVLLQVHDSLAGQYATHLGDWALRRILEEAAVPLHYPSGDLIIPVGVKTSNVSWGACG